MRRPIARLLVAALALALVLPVTRAAGQTDCMRFTRDSLRPAVEGAAVIVVATIAPGTADGTVLVTPQTYLKGAAESRSFLLHEPEPSSQDACPPAALAEGSTMLLLLESTRGSLAWPDTSRAFTLAGEQAVNQDSPPWDVPQQELVDRIRGISGQSALPVGDDDGGAAIDWTGTVLPVSVALAVVFGIGLMMMRVWHRIDPT